MHVLRHGHQVGSTDHLVMESAYEKCSPLNKDCSFAMLLQSIQHGGEKKKVVKNFPSQQCEQCCVQEQYTE